MSLPAKPGTYALCLSLEGPCRLQVGAFGTYQFPAGFYVYLGSAYGPGGLAARLGRHQHGRGKPRWHIDYLRSSARVEEVIYAVQMEEEGESLVPLECSWSQALSRLPGALIPVPRFGASDCRSGCPAHLVAFPDGISAEVLRKACRGCSGGRD